jgi:hypothetical protein
MRRWQQRIRFRRKVAVRRGPCAISLIRFGNY